MNIVTSALERAARNVEAKTNKIGKKRKTRDPSRVQNDKLRETNDPRCATVL